jgi:hypothetical protein
LPDRLEPRDRHGAVTEARVSDIDAAITVQATHHDKVRVAGISRASVYRALGAG